MISVGSGVVVEEARKGYLDLTPEALNSLVSREPITSHYHVEHTPFARGKFAAVRRAQCLTSGTWFAAKVIRKRRRAQDVRHEILHEAAVLLLARTANRIVSLHQLYETASEMVLVLELAEGGELQRVIDEEESLAEDVVRRYMNNILAALRFLHSHNIAHLDLKPQNLLLMGQHPDTEVKLCDFGISRIILSDIEVREVLGTPDYVAPEILQYEPISLATDMWSAGVLAYVLLTGHSPFGGDTKQETFLNISQGQLDFPDDLFGHVSQHAIRFITQLLVVEPSGRLTVDEALQHPWLTGIHSPDRPLPISTLSQPISIPSSSPKSVSSSSMSCTSVPSCMSSKSVSSSSMFSKSVSSSAVSSKRVASPTSSQSHSSPTSRSPSSSVLSRPPPSPTHTQTAHSPTHARTAHSPTHSRPVHSPTHSKRFPSPTNSHSPHSPTNSHSAHSLTNSRAFHSPTNSRLVSSSTHSRLVPGSTHSRPLSSPTRTRLQPGSCHRRSLSSPTPSRIFRSPTTSSSSSRPLSSPTHTRPHPSPKATRSPKASSRTCTKESEPQCASTLNGMSSYHFRSTVGSQSPVTMCPATSSTPAGGNGIDVLGHSSWDSLEHNSRDIQGLRNRDEKDHNSWDVLGRSGSGAIDLNSNDTLVGSWDTPDHTRDNNPGRLIDALGPGNWAAMMARQAREQELFATCTSSPSFHPHREDVSRDLSSGSPRKPSKLINKENNKNTLNKTEDMTMCKDGAGQETPTKTNNRLAHTDKKRETEKVKRETEKVKREVERNIVNSSKEGKENKENGKEGVKEKLKPSPLCLRRQGSKCDLNSPTDQQKYGASTVSIILEKSIIC